MNGPIALFHVTVKARSMNRDTEQRVIVFKLEAPTGPDADAKDSEYPALWEKQSAAFAYLECLEGVGDLASSTEQQRVEQIEAAKDRIPDHLPNEDIIDIEEIER